MDVVKRWAPKPLNHRIASQPAREDDMKRHGLLNAELNGAIAALGHGDILIVCDAGFPIPTHVRRIDLAIVEGLPTLEQVLKAVAAEYITEKVIFAEEVRANNPPLAKLLEATFGPHDLDTVTHAEMLTTVASKAKVVVRTGDFNPWGNIALVSGVDAKRWFDRADVVTPPFYQERIARG